MIDQDGLAAWLRLTLTPGIDAVSSMQLAQGDKVSEPIAVLKIGTAQAERQSLVLVNADRAVGSTIRLSLAGRDDLTFELSADQAAQAVQLESLLEQWFGADNVKVSVQSMRQAGWGFDIVLAGSMVGENISPIKAKVSTLVGDTPLGLNVSTVRDGLKSPTREEQAFLIQSALRKSLGDSSLTVTAGAGLVATYDIRYGTEGDVAQLRALSLTGGTKAELESLLRFCARSA